MSEDQGIFDLPEHLLPQESEAAIAGWKRCGGECELWKPGSAFVKNARRSDNKASWCKACNLRNARRAMNHRPQYIQKAGHKCEACKRPEILIALALDHDHVTGRNRGALCNDCNHALGNLKDKIAHIVGLLGYAALKVEYDPILLEIIATQIIPWLNDPNRPAMLAEFAAMSPPEDVREFSPVELPEAIETVELFAAG